MEFNVQLNKSISQRPGNLATQFLNRNQLDAIAITTRSGRERMLRDNKLLMAAISMVREIIRSRHVKRYTVVLDYYVRYRQSTSIPIT